MARVGGSDKGGLRRVKGKEGVGSSRPGGAESSWREERTKKGYKSPQQNNKREGTTRKTRTCSTMEMKRLLIAASGSCSLLQGPPSAACGSKRSFVSLRECAKGDNKQGVRHGSTG